MTRAHMLLVFVAVGIAAIVVGVITAVVITNRHHDDTSGALQATSDASATATWKADAIRARLAGTPVPLGTPPRAESLQPVKLMFCEPLREQGGTRIATIDPDSEGEVAYAPDGCLPDLDTSGAVLMRHPDGSTGRVAVTYVPVSSLRSDEGIVWTPATATLNGTSVVITGKYLRSARVEPDDRGDPQVFIHMTDDGEKMSDSSFQRVDDFILATFVDGQPLPVYYGRGVAPTIWSRSHDSIKIGALDRDEINRIVVLINNGLAQ